MVRARPVVSSTSIKTVFICGSPGATSKRAGWPSRNFRKIAVLSIPMIPLCGPVIPTSVWNAVPPGSTCSSAVATCVCVPITADTRPSRYHPMAIFSLVVSA